MLALLLALAPGCTIVGVVVGGTMSATPPPPHAVGAVMSRPISEKEFTEHFEIERGDTVEITTLSGIAVNGTYLGLSRSSTGSSVDILVRIENEAPPAKATRLPRKSFEAPPEIRRVAIADVRVIRNTARRNSWAYGFALGVALDTAILFATLLAKGGDSYSFR